MNPAHVEKAGMLLASLNSIPHQATNEKSWSRQIRRFFVFLSLTLFSFSIAFYPSVFLNCQRVTISFREAKHQDDIDEVTAHRDLTFSTSMRLLLCTQDTIHREDFQAHAPGNEASFASLPPDTLPSTRM